MFTGLVEEQGTVAALEHLDDGLCLHIHAPEVIKDAARGDSIAVDGVCLTVTDLDIDSGTFSADVMQESLDRSSLGTLDKNHRVNLERALQAGGRMGGHIVQGHVDATARLLKTTSSEHWEVYRFELPENLAKYVVAKGSITVSGVSLTVSSVADTWFEVSLIPTTLKETTLGALNQGAVVNIEVDIMGKYVEKLLQAGTPTGYTFDDSRG